ncbi:MAG: hypothetical protein DMG91_16515 [Acidobacteria bacterium]|jgi:hypothetical protein|nr:MAG: hypothetical protein DMG91_16515 [Acidobacteriota bacterium]
MRVTGLFLFLMLGLCSVLVVAQDATSDTKGKAATRTITGCLQKGDSSDEFNLVANDGSTWEVKSTQANLADHVGHTVNVTGVVENNKMHNLKEDAKDTAHDTGMKKDNREHGHLTVTDVQMVSSSCSQ